MIRKFKSLIFIVLFAVASLLVANFVLAQDIGLDYAGNLGLQDGGGQDIRDLLVSIVRYLLTFLGIVAVVIIMYGGWLWMSSNGDPSKIDKAKKTIISALIGLIIILSAFAIVSFIANKINSGLSGLPTCNVDNVGDCNGCNLCDYDGANYYWHSSPSCGPGCTGSLPGEFTFAIVSTVPDGASADDQIRNLKVRYNFTDRVNSDTVNNTTFIVYDVTDGVAVDGTIDVNNRQITFTPANGTCDANLCGADNCFPANHTINVRATTDIESVHDSNLSCLDGSCEIEFTVGDLIDCQDPVVNINSETQACIGSTNYFGFSASDDSGVAQVNFSDNFTGSAAFDGTEPVLCGGATSCDIAPSPPEAAAWTPTEIAGYLAGTSYTITAIAEDLDSNTDSDSQTFILRPEHCCNDLLDEAEGEEGVDCGGECAACSGAACGISMADSCTTNPANCDNNQCASGFCNCGAYGSDCQDKGYDTGINDCCVCEDKPIIDWVTPVGGFCRDSSGNPTNTPCSSDDDCSTGILVECDTETPNGAPGNFVTIGGRFFGNDIGTVEFNGVLALLANNPVSGNTNCGNVWTDNQIIVVVPTGLTAGAGTIVTVNNSSGSNDTTGVDGRGPEIDFVVNDISRPGLCDIDPEHGSMDEIVNYQGIRLNGVIVGFGNLISNILSSGSSFTSNTSGTALVPNINTGRTSTFVINASDIASNFLDFEKDPEPYVGPAITSFDPTEGTEGQYVTIYGNGFSSRRGTSRVYFDLDVDDGIDGTPADFDFPDVCADSVWSDNQILIKVPALPNDPEDYYLVIDLQGLSDPIDTSGLDFALSTFRYDTTLPLSPSLCKIEPTTGPNNSLISLYGEYFGSEATGLVRFNLSNDQTGGSWSSAGNVDKIETIVHQDAVSGPVRVVQGGDEGNAMNFNVGNCSDNDDCGAGGICCPAGSFKESLCAVDAAAQGGDGSGTIDINDCYTKVTGSVFEWEFTTDFGSGPGSPCYDPDSSVCTNSLLDECPTDYFCDPDAGCTCQPINTLDDSQSCQEYSYGSGACYSILCPNSPGQCSAGLYTAATISCNCNELYDSMAFYSEERNRCVGPTCSIDEDAVVTIGSIDIDLGNYYNLSCRNVGGNYFWQLNPGGASCPDANWVLEANGWCSLATTTSGSLTKATCSVCPPNFGRQCVVDNGADNIGICVINREICPSGEDCVNVSGDYICDGSSAPDEICDCCCRKANENQDCCTYEDSSGNIASLTCEGVCGEDADGSDSGTYGNCSGCANAPDPDGACNCEGTSGKFCDLSDANYPDGVCRDCSNLGSRADECSSHDTCCFNGNNSRNQCTGLGSKTIYFDSGINYCAYFSCDTSDPYDCLETGISGDYIEGTCSNECGPPGISGGSSCYSEILGNCSLTCDAGYSCLGETGCTGGGCGSYDNSCTCCCVPGSNDCSAINADLVCQENISPCSGNNRGLCCGCSGDNDCSTALPTAVGCGDDRCCHGRPSIEAGSPLPSDDSVDICRNTLISATFDQRMDITSFSGNVIVFGDYDGDVCPAGTQYLATNYDFLDKNIFVRLFSKAVYKILNFISPKLARAYTPASAAHNYCAITGTVSGYNNATDQGVVNFSPSRLLDPDTLYYAVIRGDRNLDSSRGVLNTWGVGMNGHALNNSDYTFNGINYENSYIWSFRTMPETADNNGVCILDHVDIDPSSYLFQEAGQEQEFEALPKTNRDQIISPIPGVYGWGWNWRSDNEAVARIVANENTAISTAAAQNVRDARTYLRATATIIEDNVISPNTVGQAHIGRARVFVFLCANPWPPIDPGTGTWEPWSDESNNCTLNPGAEGCNYDFNYEIYYCRDAGGVGTYDDLPVIGSDENNNAVVRGSIGLVCSDGQGDCAGLSLGDSCGDSGTCQREILKEYYFMRAPEPEAVTNIVLSDYDVGESATISWSVPVPFDPEIDGYRLYWGTESGNYTNFEDASMALTWTVEGLVNNTEYCFNLTSYYENGNESEYYGEECVTVTDTNLPDSPVINDFVASNGEVYLSWDAIDDAVNYRVYYGVTTGVYGSSQNIGNETEIIISGLTNSTEYHFVVTAVDAEGNESIYSNEVTATPEDSIPVSFGNAGDIIINWDTAGIEGEYVLYYEEIE